MDRRLDLDDLRSTVPEGNLEIPRRIFYAIYLTSSFIISITVCSL